VLTFHCEMKYRARLWKVFASMCTLLMRQSNNGGKFSVQGFFFRSSIFMTKTEDARVQKVSVKISYDFAKKCFKHVNTKDFFFKKNPFFNAEINRFILHFG